MHARWPRAALLALAAGALALVSTSGGAPRPHLILLLTLDTTRADHLAIYGYPRPTSPALARLAARGVLVRHAITPMPMTDPAHTSIFTGLHPRTHGIRLNGHCVADPEVANLASWARALGYRTAAFVSRAHLRPAELGLRGFEFESGPSGAQRVGAQTLALASRWIREHATEPSFVWVHLFDQHAPYGAPPPYTTRFLEPGDPARVKLRGNEAAREPYTAPEVRALTALYDGEIAYTDDLVGQLIALVEEIAPPGNAPLIVVAGDHGEALGELDARHRYAFDHGQLLYQGSLEVPLLLRWDGVLPAGREVAGPASLVDLAPTLFDLIGARGFVTQGTSLRPQIQGQEARAPGLAFSERRLISIGKCMRFRALEQFSVQDGRYKLILSTPFSRTELYDLERDPGETADLARAVPEIEARLRGAVEQWRTAWAATDAGDRVIPAEKREQLRALGYVE